MLKTKLQNKKNIWLLLFVCVGILASLRMFWQIGGDYFTFLDEYPTFDVAAGFARSGKFYFWDFHRQVLSNDSYTRAWPHTLLLAGWFQMFGINVVAGKTLSGVFGVLFVLSLFYITGKLYDDMYISCLSCLLVMTNSTVITVFRQIRMYSLWLLVMVWLIYFLFRMMTAEPRVREPLSGGAFAGVRNHIVCWWQKNLNFSVWYILLSLLFLVLSYFVHVNTLAIGVGIIAFYLYLLAVKRERRYVSALFVVTGLVLLVVLAFLLLPHYGGTVEELDLWGVIAKNVSLREEVNERYWNWTEDFFHNVQFFWFSLVCFVTALVIQCVKKKDEKQTLAFDFTVYLFLATGSSLVCFLYLLKRYYQARYILYIAPMLAVLAAWGIVECCGVLAEICGRYQQRLAKYILPFVSVCCVLLLGISMGQQYIEVYANEEICYHRQVYEIVKKDGETHLDDGTIPIVAFDFRNYYAVQVLPDYAVANLDRENDADIWMNFAKEYPEGYLMLESAKINGFPEVTKRFVQDYSERVTGEGLDSYNIETVRYHFLDPVKGDGEEMESDVIIAYECVDSPEGMRLRIRLDTGKLDSGVRIVFLNFVAEDAGQEPVKRSYQLRLPEQPDQEVYLYEVIVGDAHGDALREEGIMLYYNDGTVVEYESQDM